MESQNEQNINEAMPQETALVNNEESLNQVQDKINLDLVAGGQNTNEVDIQSQIPAEPEKKRILTAPVRRKKKERRGGALKRQKQEIMNDPEKRKKSVKLGVTSIILCVLSMALCYPAVWLAFQIVVHGFTHFYYVIGNVVVVCAGLALPGLLLISQVYQLSFSIAQLKIRKDWFGWVCLAFSILTVFAIMVLCFISLKPVLNGLG